MKTTVRCCLYGAQLVHHTDEVLPTGQRHIGFRLRISAESVLVEFCPFCGDKLLVESGPEPEAQYARFSKGLADL